MDQPLLEGVWKEDREPEPDQAPRFEIDLTSEFLRVKENGQTKLEIDFKNPIMLAYGLLTCFGKSKRKPRKLKKKKY